MVDRARLVEAVSLLTESKQYALLAKELTSILENWAWHPMQYAGQLSPLNALIELGLKSHERFLSLLKAIEAERNPPPKQRRNDYQRDLMAERRARMAKSIQIREFYLERKMTPAEKERHSRKKQKEWQELKELCFTPAEDGLSWKERNQKTQEFWAWIDADLDTTVAELSAPEPPIGA
jgi:hypothetical protein